MNFILVTSVVLSITAICEGGVTNGKIENVDEKNQTKRSIANAFSSNPIFRRVFHRGYSQNSLQNRFFDHSDAYDKYPQENYKISSQVIYIRPFSETVTTASPNDNKELNIFDNSEEDENEGNDQLKNVNEKSMEEEDAASGNVTTQITVFSVTKEEENVKSELYDYNVTPTETIDTNTMLNSSLVDIRTGNIQYNNNYSDVHNVFVETTVKTTTTTITEPTIAPFVSKELTNTPKIAPFVSKELTNTTEFVSEELTNTTSSTEFITVGEYNSQTNNGTTQFKNLTHNSIAPSETSTLQLDKATRDRIFVILNKRLLNSLRFPQNRTNETLLKPQEQHIFTNSFLEESNLTNIHTTTTTERNIVLFRPSTPNYEKNALTDQSLKGRSKPRKNSKKKTSASGEISPLGNVLAQFFIQAIGYNNKNNPYNISNGVSTKGNIPESNLQDLVKLWRQGANKTASSEPNFGESISSTAADIDVRSKDKDSTRTLSNLNGLKLEQTLNRRINRESNLFTK